MSERTEQVWREYGGRLRAWFRRRVDQDAEADDLLSETFLRIHDRIGDLRDEERLAPWLFRVAANVLTDARRARAAANRRERAAAVPDRQHEDDVPLDATVGAWLRDMVDDLPETVREAVRLVELDALPGRDAAARLGVSETALKSRTRRGRDALRKAVLACCHLEFDRRGHVVETTRRRRSCCEGEGE